MTIATKNRKGEMGPEQVKTLDRVAPGVTIITTDANASLALTDKSIKHTGTLTASRTLSLPSGAVPGQVIHVIRLGAGVGSLEVGSLTSLSVRQWCDVTWDGSAWYVSAWGTTPA